MKRFLLLPLTLSLSSVILLSACGNMSPRESAVSNSSAGNKYASSSLSVSYASEEADSSGSVPGTESASSFYTFPTEKTTVISKEHDAAAPDFTVFNDFFSSYGAKTDSSPDSGSGMILYTGSGTPIYCGYLNYNDAGSILHAAGFQIYGTPSAEDTAEFLIQAASLMFPETDKDAWSAFIKECIGSSDNEEHMYSAESGKSSVMLITRPIDTAAPNVEMIVTA